MRAQTALLHCAHRYLILTCLLASLCSIPMGCLDVSICIYITMNKHSMTHKLVECEKVGEVAHGLCGALLLLSGGITAENAAEIIQAGAAGVAVITALVYAEDI